MSTLDILGLCGSLRASSFNRMALNLAGSVMPPTMKMEVADWRNVPVFDADQLASGMPASVTALRERIRRADAVLIATTEYNFSIPGGLKNLIEWVSRGDDQPLAGKPLAILLGLDRPTRRRPRPVRPAQGDAVRQCGGDGQARGLHRQRRGSSSTPPAVPTPTRTRSSS